MHENTNRLKCVIACVVWSGNSLKAASCVVVSASRTKLVGPIAKLHNCVIVNSIALTHLVWMLDMDTEAQLLQDPPFRFDDLVFGIYVVLIKYQRTWSPSLQRNQNKIMFPPFEMKVIKKVPFWFFVLFSFFRFNQLRATGLTVIMPDSLLGFVDSCGSSESLRDLKMVLNFHHPVSQLQQKYQLRSSPTSLTQRANTFNCLQFRIIKLIKCWTPINNCHKSSHILLNCIHQYNILLQNNLLLFFCLWNSRLARLKG